MTSGRRYPNQQLRSVSLETFFPGRFSAFTKLDSVQEAVEDRLPHLFVPNVKGGEAIATRPYQLRDQAGHESLHVAVNQISYVSYEYPGHETFMQQALGILPTCYELLSIGQLNRVVYRYDNEIGLARKQDGTLPVEAVLDVHLPGERVGSGFSNLDLTWTEPTDHGHLATHIAVGKEDGHEVLRIAIAAIVSPAGSVARIEELARTGHDVAIRAFEAMITPDFRKFISQEREEG